MKRSLQCFDYKHYERDMEVSFNLLTDIYNLMIIMAIFTFINKNNTQLFSLGLKLPFDISISLGYAVYDNEPEVLHLLLLRDRMKECIRRRGFITRIRLTG